MARITARVDTSRHIEFSATEFRHFDHGYAVTSHSSQGLTAERVLVNADTGVHPDLLNSYSQPVLYAHFGSREGILVAVAIEGFQEIGWLWRRHGNGLGVEIRSKWSRMHIWSSPRLHPRCMK
jgi:hypothetical protein